MESKLAVLVEGSYKLRDENGNIKQEGKLEELPAEQLRAVLDELGVVLPEGSN